MSDAGEVTRLISEMRNGNAQAAERLMPLVYKELRSLAAAVMQRERPGHTLQPTAVVHEAYLRLVAGSELSLENRAHFFALAARSMRQVLVDHARRKLAGKRGGEVQHRVELEDHLALTEQQSEEVLGLHEALDRLDQLDSRQAQIVEMHYFAGNPVEEIAAVLQVSERTVKRELQTARLFLKKQLKGTGAGSP
ncbi:MAG: RNA polymerase subunit sigma-70 [Terriglobia bacterium]|nr:MAG: RNA polymerase subunit sigma-70 [Terriglobia bacterium]